MAHPSAQPSPTDLTLAHPSPHPSPMTSPQVNEYTWLPGSRMWDTDEVRGLQLDMDKPPMSNLVCLEHFCPAWAGEEEPTELQESTLRGPEK